MIRAGDTLDMLLVEQLVARTSRPCVTSRDGYAAFLAQVQELVA